MAGASELIVKITGKDVGLKSALHDAGNDVDNFGSKLASFGKTAALGLGAAAVGIGAVLVKSVQAAEEARKVMAQTEAVIKSTGGAANVTAAQVGKYADELAALTGIDDEVIASGQNMLLTFTNIRNEVGKGNDIFNQATKSALNMSVAMGTDLNSASLLVGKALNDPIAGMTALTRAGVQFTTQQKDQIAAMVAAGDTLGAQKIILKELETQFGGSAEAAASPMERLKVVIGNLQEEIGARFLPVIATAAEWLAERLPPAFEKVSAGAAVVVAFVKEHWPEIQSTVSAVMEAVQSVISGVVDVVTTIWTNFGSQIVSYAREAWDAIMQVVGGAMDVIQGIIKTVTSIIQGDWSGAWEGIKQILSGAWSVINGIIDQSLNVMQTIFSVGLEILGSIVSAAFEGIVGFIGSVPGRILDALGDLGDLLVEAGLAVMRGFLRGLKAGWESVKGFVGGIAGKIADLKGPIEKDRKLLIPQGQAIMDSLVKGLRSHESMLVGYLGQVSGMVGGVGGSPAGAGLMGGSSGAAAGTVSGPSNITINITMQAGADPQHLAREIAWAIGA